MSDINSDLHTSFTVVMGATCVYACICFSGRQRNNLVNQSFAIPFPHRDIHIALA